MKRGRRSLNGAGDSPQLRVRVSDELRAELARRAAREDVTVSEFARRILADTVRNDRREVRVQLELHRALLAKLLDNPDAVREIANRNIERMRNGVRGEQAQGWLDEWSDLVDRLGPELIDAFVGLDEHSIDLRQVSPFAGVLTDDERLAATKRARSASH